MACQIPAFQYGQARMAITMRSRQRLASLNDCAEIITGNKLVTFDGYR